jgi:drug/metabolite transporter (DMT)-like permease
MYQSGAVKLALEHVSYPENAGCRMIMLWSRWACSTQSARRGNEACDDPTVETSSVLPYVWMLLGSFSFAVMAMMSHQLGSLCDWRITALARSGLAFAFAAALAPAVGSRLVFRRPCILWVRSLAGSVSLVCAFYAQSLMRPPELLTITSTFPLWVALLSWPLLRERPSAVVWLSAVTGVAGVFLVYDPHLEGGALAAALAFLASFCTAIAMLGLHRLQDLDTLAIVVHFSGVAFAFCVALVFLGPNGPPVWSRAAAPEAFLRLLGVGVTATIGQFFLTRAFAGGPPAKVSVVGLTQIVFAIGLDVLASDRSFTPTALLGMVLVMAPTAWVMAGRTHE